MKLQWADRFGNDYGNLPAHVQRQADRKLKLLLINPRHPSLHTKKMQGAPGEQGIHEARVSTTYRFTFQIVGDTYLLRRIGTHEIYRAP